MSFSSRPPRPQENSTFIDLTKRSNTPQISPLILKTPYGNPRSLASIAATLHIHFSHYTEAQLNHYPNGNPDFSLPFFWVSLTSTGLIIRIPEKLYDKNLKVQLEEICKQTIYDVESGEEFLVNLEEGEAIKLYRGEITIPLEDIKSFLEEKLNFEDVTRRNGKTMSFIEDLLDVHGEYLTVPQRRTVVEGKICQRL